MKKLLLSIALVSFVAATSFAGGDKCTKDKKSCCKDKNAKECTTKKEAKACAEKDGSGKCCKDKAKADAKTQTTKDAKAAAPKN